MDSMDTGGLSGRPCAQNLPVCESKHCNANARRQARLSPTDHTGDVQDIPAASQPVRYRGGEVVGIQSLPAKPQSSLALPADLLRLRQSNLRRVMLSS